MGGSLRLAFKNGEEEGMGQNSKYRSAILRHIGIVRLHWRNLSQLHYWLRGKAKYNIMSTVKKKQQEKTQCETATEER